MLARNRGEREVAISGPSTHAAPSVRIQARQRWSGHPRTATLPWAQEHPAHGAVHRALSGAVQIVLGGTDVARSRALDRILSRLHMNYAFPYRWVLRSRILLARSSMTDLEMLPTYWMKNNRAGDFVKRRI